MIRRLFRTSFRLTALAVVAWLVREGFKRYVDGPDAPASSDAWPAPAPVTTLSPAAKAAPPAKAAAKKAAPVKKAAPAKKAPAKKAAPAKASKAPARKAPAKKTPPAS